jgi:zinc transporter, ZIP family
MSEFVLVAGIAALAAGLIYLGAPLAERFEVPQRVVSGALQFAAGIITALVAVTLMPPAMRNGPYALNVLAFFVGGALYVLIEYSTKPAQVERGAGSSGAVAAASASGQASLGLFAGVLVDVFVDGVVVGLGSTLNLLTGLVMAIGMALSTAPLVFISIVTAKRQGMAPERRRVLGWLFGAATLAGALLGFLVLQNQPVEVRMVLVSLASGFLITTVVQGIVPEANREGEPGLAGLLFIGGLSLYLLMSLALQ